MAKVGIVMGSDSDLPIMSKAAAMLEKFGIEYEMTIISAHRMPDIFFDYAKTAKDKGFQVIIECTLVLNLELRQRKSHTFILHIIQHL